MKDLKYFKISEFDSPDLPNSGVNMDKDFLRLLDKLRERVGFPMIVNSGFRTHYHNRKVGGVASSSHTRGLAVDIKIKGNYERFKIVSEALKLGINRIGVYKTFVHLDVDKSLVENVIWYQ